MGTIGFIGGSGIYEALPLNDVREVAFDTPYGEPSDAVTIGEFGDTGREVAFLPRHGSNHGVSPTDLPYRANMYALKQAGVTHVFASNAVGSLKEELAPGTLVVPDQIYDRTKYRDLSFYGDGVVVHQPFADPYSPELVDHLTEAAESAVGGEEDDGTDVVKGGTYVCIEGPQYSTRAESEFYKSQGWDLVGMTAIPEAKLAREAEIAYATIAGVTDYDVWKADSEVTLEEVLENAEQNQAAIKAAVEEAVRTLPEDLECDAHTSLEGTVNTPTEAIPEETKERVEPLLGDYL
ncbi:S-methyl-5'-thioadenosine phosphorylase [Halorubrum ezzemoulense]|uniref:Purine nucleoside phosphorylase n=1 Tax=Halorubrum ezzemoulense TaxID=337243 RepID=A0ABT4Z4H8_HALEZ|nr:S-methyl-5'-thioadenosine phosphorylase [Halorubrum ezzemoulense]MDB2245010.1 S-methyl-5'-thioadenosine phosphorylase [Halorubrum ezzemoulense]MDB2251217.1 S-methyl-5'-thioadenosine phosphorylase [Halorubrum ezzemoulense]MDB2278233.1 S-methyl-5'-thioadenosine phosphorylase [Halorubrum ezzemoulense]MDB2284907.1 S-methyl-5'-thioadenosine phosphorylase [Halorubrum ezzemoulense]MDB2288345.1 S-methyl-5'-thioadenosine phosphorylase [Halorubrum ezzemoulense]